MKRVFIYILLFYCGLIISCGPNKQEKAQLDLIQLKHDDSIRASAINEVMLKIREREDSIAFIKREEEKYYFHIEKMADFMLEFRYGLPRKFYNISDSTYAIGFSKFLLNDSMSLRANIINSQFLL